MEVKKDRRGRQTRGTNYITGGIFFLTFYCCRAQQLRLLCFMGKESRKRSLEFRGSNLQAQEQLVALNFPFNVVLNCADKNRSLLGVSVSKNEARYHLRRCRQINK